MLVHVPEVLTQEEVAYCRHRLEQSAWVDGGATAGEQAAKIKHNLQIPEDAPVARELGEIVLRALSRSALFTTAALPYRVYPPMFNRYDVGMDFGAHVDNAIRLVAQAGIRIRTDVSTTLFLTDPGDYDGGELVVQDTYGTQEVKLPAGDMVVYPATSLHRVNPVTRGSRWSSFFWSQSMVKDNGQREQLYTLDMGIIQVRQDLPDDHPGVLALTSTYHNLLRRWADL
ncbi:Fe2+-dependent dioxygenase [Roseomonas sp. NAR14]|uniref:Fe2+-dependent dioxygenase n=1 Tax=Roseomonas acroporae TaxID=2937791 RepID=A0A9X1YA52_9PROT|nr:Fe2+-dependent dioxygenase [Roseomonas acroporae]MCK8785195.1 Fe2+-dependent dioxygenase [Roseomonas acroporae]